MTKDKIDENFKEQIKKHMKDPEKYSDPFNDTASKVSVPTVVLYDLIVNKGLNYSQTAKVLNANGHVITPEGIAKRCKKHGIIRKTDLDGYKMTRSDQFAMKQAQILDGMDSESIEKASLRDKAIALGTLYDKERLERGQSTENIEFADITNEIDELRKQYDEIQKKKSEAKMIADKK